MKKYLIIIFYICYAPNSYAGKFIVGIGEFDIKHDLQLESRFEYRFQKSNNCFYPFAGLMIAEKGSKSLYMGLGASKQFLKSYRANISIAPTFYNKGNGKDLGGRMQFTSQVELWKLISNKHAFGISASHTSNAGRKKKNPGKESILLQYEMSF